MHTTTTIRVLHGKGASLLNQPFLRLIPSLTLLLFLILQGTSWAEPVNFDRDIRPILADKCYACHGPDSKTREAELRLDTKQGALGVCVSSVQAGSE
jgi:hypothetical protein